MNSVSPPETTDFTCHLNLGSYLALINVAQLPPLLSRLVT